MSPKNYMILGAIVALIAVVIALIGEGAIAVVVGFGGGALFGKGYGIFEELTRDRKP
jgi:hypothetical protein